MNDIEFNTLVKEISLSVCRILTSGMQYPEFATGSVPIEVAAKVFSKNPCWVRAGIENGWLPIGTATRLEGSKRANFYISPKLLWEYTGYIWKGELS